MLRKAEPYKQGAFKLYACFYTITTTVPLDMKVL